MNIAAFLKEYWAEIVALVDKIYAWIKDMVLANDDAE